MAKPHKTVDEAATQITRDHFSWATKLDTSISLTWAFRSSIPAKYVNSSHNESKTFERMDVVERNQVRDALELFSDVAGIKFTQKSASGKTDDFSNAATLLFGTYSADDGAAAFGNFPGKFSGDKSVTSNEGDVWYNRFNSGASSGRGGYDFYALIHEVGHALGLEHPGDYNAGKGVKNTYVKNAVYAEDTRQYTVMSYFEASDSGNGADHSYKNAAGKTITVYASTLLRDDIAAIQHLYGVATARTGDTIYGFNSNADVGSYHIFNNDQVVFCIYDTGGTDTFDVSGYKTDQNIDLRAGSFSDVGLLKKNVSIAEGVTIENAIGGYGDDTITGNAADNVLTGMLGNDTLIGGAGVDTVDYTYITNSKSNLYLTLDANGDGKARVVKAGTTTSLETDTVKGVENIYAGAGNDILTGNGAANVLHGNAGDDTLLGGVGKDIIDGGAGNNSALYYDRDTSISVTLNDGGKTTVYVGGVAEDTLTNIQNIYGSGGNDVITGNTFANVLNGGFGNDLLTGGGGFDTLDGGDGSDTADYHRGADALTIDLSVTNLGYVTARTTGGLALDRLYSIENLIGSSAGDTLTGDYNNNRLVGGAGFDSLSGGYGDDTLQPGADGGSVDGGDGYDDTIDFSDQTKPVQLTLIAGGSNATFKVGGQPVGTVRNVEDILGGSGADVLTGDSEYYGNKLMGGAGNDTLYGMGGDDHLVGGLGRDFLDGGDGSDTADYSDHALAISVTLTGEEATLALYATVDVGGVAEDTLVRIENIIGGSGGDTLKSTDSADNTFRGGGGKDVLDGGANGYLGDTADYSDKTQSVLITLKGSSNAIAYVNGFAEDTLRNIENLNGGSGNDTLTGDASANNLYGGDGNDTFKLSGGFDYFDGGNGTDTLNLSTTTGAISITLETYYALLSINSNATAYVSRIEKVIGGSGEDTLNGGTGLSTLTGGAGNDAFLFNTAIDGHSVTTITDFNSGHDTINLDHTIFSAWSAATPGTNVQSANYTEGTTATTTKSGAQIIYDTENGGLYYDSDGKGGSAALEFALLSGSSDKHLTSADFFIV